MKNFYRHFALFIISALLFTACDDDSGNEKPTPGSTTITIEKTKDSDVNAVYVKFTPGNDAAGFRYAIGQESDHVTFATGDLKGTATQKGNAVLDKTFSGLTKETTYTVFAQSYDDNERWGPVSSLQITTSDGIIVTGPSTSIEAIDVTGQTVTVKIISGTGAEKIAYAIGSAGDLTSFQNGGMSGIEEKTTSGEMTATFEGLTGNEDYTVFARSFDADGVAGETATLVVSTDGADVTFQFTDYSQFEVSATVTPNEFVSECRVYLFATWVFDMHYGDASDEETWEMLLNGNEKPVVLTQTDTRLYRLNGNTSYEMVFISLVYDKNGNRKKLRRDYYTSPAFVENTPLPDNLVLSLHTPTGVTGNTFEVIVEMGNNTTGYIYLLWTKDFFDDRLEDGRNNYPMDPYYYVRNNTSVGGSIGYETKNITYSVEPGTEYVFFATPFNVNGAEGYGNEAIYGFITPQ